MTYLDWLAQQDLETCTFKEAFQAGASSRDAEIARLKTVPMRYRRMAFNAQLQDENAKLVAALEGVSEKLKRAGASIPAPENKGTIESAITTGLSIALLLVDEAITKAKKP